MRLSVLTFPPSEIYPLKILVNYKLLSKCTQHHHKERFSNREQYFYSQPFVMMYINISNSLKELHNGMRRDIPKSGYQLVYCTPGFEISSAFSFRLFEDVINESKHVSSTIHKKQSISMREGGKQM